MNNPAIDLVIRLKNGYMAHRETIDSPYSGLRISVLKKLKELGYIQDFSIIGDNVKRIDVTLSYPDGEAAMQDVKIFSKPGRRWYSSFKELSPIGVGIGVTLLSTSKGILTHKEAKKEKVGGELLFSIW